MIGTLGIIIREAFVGDMVGTCMQWIQSDPWKTSLDAHGSGCHSSACRSSSWKDFYSLVQKGCDIDWHCAWRLRANEPVKLPG